jgi:5-enolpyruvylshikimate-3-phosphate synthase
VTSKSTKETSSIAHRHPKTPRQINSTTIRNPSMLNHDKITAFSLHQAGQPIDAKKGNPEQKKKNPRVHRIPNQPSSAAAAAAAAAESRVYKTRETYL